MPGQVGSPEEFLHFLEPGVWFIELQFWVLLCIRARLQSCRKGKERELGFQPLQWQSCTKCIAHLSMVQGPVKAGLTGLLGREKSAGAKAHIFVDLERHD
jgi:hypothetical protein